MSDSRHPSQGQLLTVLREAEQRALDDESVALLVSAYIEAYGDVPLNDVTLAGGMLMLAARRVTSERAEMLLEQLAANGQVEAETRQEAGR